ncbi:uncharacterized protein LOC125501354 [Athalia rosae]|uniref:uncharacterized protein LOC125501354 n=1 Tax=Athalia rosae TaxID=37344 RepID=UPI002034A7A7|nr:uncharacterized protein LOC125501354 [Athalia rosae]
MNRYGIHGSADDTPEKLSAYPDANSHSNYNLLTEDTQSFDSWTRNHRGSYSAANREDEGNYFQDSNSHGRYDVPSDASADRNFTDIRFVADGSSRSAANSHGTYRILSESSDRTATGDNEDLSREILIPPEESNYEIANSHSNYKIFYNSQTHFERRDRPIPRDDDGRVPNTGNFNANSSPTRSDSSRSSRSTEETSTTCDIEECLVQIEESLLNIEQNLLHVQDLDIPELKNLLYKSPSIDRSLFEVQDLLCTENLESVKRGQLFAFNFENPDNIGDLSLRELSPDSDDHDTFTNDDNLLLQFNDEKINAVSDQLQMAKRSEDVNVNFVPNSLGRTPTRRDFGGAGENIKSYSLDNGDFSDDGFSKMTNFFRDNTADVINDNLNSRIEEKKTLDGKKCNSRTNSLDENSMSVFQDPELPGIIVQRKSSLESLRLSEKSRENYLEANSKAKSDDTLDNKLSYNEKRKFSRRSKRRSKENRLAEVEAKTEEFRRKIESIISSRKSIIPNLETGQKTSRSQGANDNSSGRKSSRENSPRIRNSSLQNERTAASGKKLESPNARQSKSNSFEKGKRKKTSRIHSAENAALVPSKLISLSLSLLLAALLQAVRCLTDLVEDAFRSVSFDRNGLLE